MPFVVPKIVGLEDGKSFRIMSEQCKPTLGQLKEYVKWLEAELAVALKAVEEIELDNAVPE
jgi:hypothetical protein